MSNHVEFLLNELFLFCPNACRLIARRSPIVPSKEKYTPIASPSSTTKVEAAKKLVTPSTMPWKPVQKLIISLNADDSSTTDFEDDADAWSETDKNNGNNSLASGGMSAEALRAFDNASPASIAMDSPLMAPCSPIDGETLLAAPDDASDDSRMAKNSAPTTDAFQMKLDEYLKQVRAKTDATQEMLPSIGGGMEKKSKPDKPKTIISLKQKTPVVCLTVTAFCYFLDCTMYIYVLSVLSTGCLSSANISAAGIPSLDQSDENFGKTERAKIVTIQTTTIENATECANSHIQSTERSTFHQYSCNTEEREPHHSDQ